jgi:HK97 family phage major capsid protein
MESARNDAGAAVLVNEIKAAFEQFKAANDERIKAIEGRRSDPLAEEKVERIEASITDLQSRLVDVAAQAAFRSNGADRLSESDVKAAANFSRLVGAEVSADHLKEYQAGLASYFRVGSERIGSDVRAAMQVGSDPNGGYLVAPDMSGRIITRIYETSPMRSVASVVTIGTDALEGINDLEQADFGWAGETDARPVTGAPKIGKWRIPVHESYANPRATQKMLDDASVDIEAWLAGKIADRLARAQNAAFVAGDGVLKPRGLFSYPTSLTNDATRPWGTFQHLNTGTSAGFGAAPAGSDTLIDTVFALKAGYRGNASWMMSRATLGTVRKLKDGDGNYLWQPDFQTRVGGTLLGFPIVEAEDVPAIGADSLSIAFGDFAAAYQIVDRLGLRIVRDVYSTKPYVQFYTTARVGGDVLNFEAVKFVRFATSG